MLRIQIQGSKLLGKPRVDLTSPRSRTSKAHQMTQPPTIRLARSAITLNIYVILHICMSHPHTQCCSCYHYIFNTNPFILTRSSVKLTPWASKAHSIDRKNIRRHSSIRPPKLSALQRPPINHRRTNQQTTLNPTRRQHPDQSTSRHQAQQQVRILTPQGNWSHCRHHCPPNTTPNHDDRSKKVRHPTSTVSNNRSTPPRRSQVASPKCHIHTLQPKQSGRAEESRTHNNTPSTDAVILRQSATKSDAKMLLNTSHKYLRAIAKTECDPHTGGSRHHRNPNRNNSIPPPIKNTHDRKHRSFSTEKHHVKSSTPPPSQTHQRSPPHSPSLSQPVLLTPRDADFSIQVVLISSRNSGESLLAHSHSPSHPSPYFSTNSITWTLQCSLLDCRYPASTIFTAASPGNSQGAAISVELCPIASCMYTTPTLLATAGPGNTQGAVEQEGGCSIADCRKETPSATVGLVNTQGATNQKVDRRATAARASTHNRSRPNNNSRQGQEEDTSNRSVNAGLYNSCIIVNIKPVTFEVKQS